ncbi:MAG TPA: hypothetical protein VK169_10965 [Saprospiraceae bacterium]|nr:hypothetical protein [Saprospiraceae bacterium]
MEASIHIINEIINVIPLLVLFYFINILCRMAQRNMELSNVVELEQIRNQHQKDMFDKNKEKEMKLLEMKNSHDLEILKEKKI